MTARPKRLTAHFVANVKTSKSTGEVFGDGRGGYGLSLLVKPYRDGTGYSKSWIQRIRFTDEFGTRRYRNIGLGGYPIVSLDMARQKALMNQQAIAQKEIAVSPVIASLKSHKASAPVASPPSSGPSFRDVALMTLEVRKANWKPGSVTEKNWLSRLNKHIYPRIGDMPISSVTPSDIATWLIDLNVVSPSVGLSVANMLVTIFQQARARGYIDENPMDIVKVGLSNGARKPTNHSALPYGEARQAIDAFNAYDTSEANKDLFKFILLTAVRRDEARLAKWGEMNWEEKILVVPYERVKAKAAYQHQHVLPLSRQAFSLLERRFREAAKTGANDYIFAGPKGLPVAENATLKTFKKVWGNYTIHGLRTTFSTWGQEETDYPYEVLKSIIDHVSGTTADRAYLRSSVLSKQRECLQEWGDYLERRS